MTKKLVIAAILSALLAAGIFSGCSSSSEPATKAGTVSAGGSSKAADSQSSADKVFKVGDIVKVKGAELTVTKISKSDGSDYDKPQKDGNEFVIVSVTIKNVGTDKVDYNPFYFKMKNSQGQITQSSVTTINQSTQLQTGELSGNGSVSGDVVFEEPKNDAGLLLQYLDIDMNTVLTQVKIS